LARAEAFAILSRPGPSRPAAAGRLAQTLGVTGLPPLRLELPRSPMTQMNEHFEKDRLHHQAIAQEYDAIVVRPRVIANDVLFARFRDLVRPGGRMLDAASGTGHMVMRFGDRFTEVVALDHSDAMLAQASRKVSEKRWTHVSFEQADVLEYIEASPGEDFDLITCVGFLHHMLPEQVPGTIAGLARLLRANGTLLLSEPVKVPTNTVPRIVNDWNRMSLAASTRYSVNVDEPDEEPLDADVLVTSVRSAGLSMARLHRSFEVFPHSDPPTLRDRLAIRLLNFWYGRAGNVMTIAAQRL